MKYPNHQEDCPRGDDIEKECTCPPVPGFTWKSDEEKAALNRQGDINSLKYFANERNIESMGGLEEILQQFPEIYMAYLNYKASKSLLLKLINTLE